MAVSTIPSNNDIIVVEHKTILSNVSSSNAYYEQQVDVSKPGYKLIGAGASLSSTGLRFYKLRPLDNDKVEVGFATYNNSGSISSINVYATLTYIRKDFA